MRLHTDSVLSFSPSYFDIFLMLLCKGSLISQMLPTFKNYAIGAHKLVNNPPCATGNFGL